MTRAVTTKSLRAKLKKDMLAHAEKELREPVFLEAKELLEKLYERTFAHWNESGRNRYGVPEVKIEDIKFDVSENEVNLTISSLATEDGTNPHHLWYWLDQGTNDIVWDFPYPSAIFEQQNDWRTHPGELDPEPFHGFNDIWMILPGEVRRGITAREWSRVIAETFKQQLDGKSGELFGIPGFELVRYRINPPKLKK